MGRSWLPLLLTLGLLGAHALGDPPGDNRTEGAELEFLEDPLENWLAKFDTYTYMFEQDVGEKTVGEGVREGVGDGAEVEPGSEDPAEDMDEDYDEASAPITLRVKMYGGLLNPNLDYKVHIESLVAEGGSVLVTLGSFGNKTTCGVGGFSPTPLEETEGSGFAEGQENITSSSSGQPQQEILESVKTTIVSFSGDGEEESSTWTLGEEGLSSWEQHSEDLWWAMGRLSGGGLLTLIFTPPECGCLVVKAYYALPIGNNLTLIIGPEAYPADLEKLLCVDPTARIEDNLIEPEIDEEEEEEEVFEDRSLVEETSGEPSGISRQVHGKGRGKWVARRKIRMQKRKNRQRSRQAARQAARQAIRQAGKKVTRYRLKAHMRLRRRGEESQLAEVEGEVPQVPRGRLARKGARRAGGRKHGRKGRKAWKGKKPWKKHRKHARRNRNKHRRNRHHGRNHNGTDEGANEIYDEFSHNDTSVAEDTEEDALADLLLGDEAKDDLDADTGDEALEEDVAVSDDATGAGSGAGPLRRRGRKHRRQRAKARKMKNKEKRKGSRFCCKQGIKYKKMKLGINSTITEEGTSDIECNTTNDVVSTYAAHQFGIDSDLCLSRYETCCSKFTAEIWENVQARKLEKKERRKSQRKAARQDRRRKGRRQGRASTTQSPPTSVTPEA